MGNGNKAVAYPTDKRTGIGDGQGCRAIGQDEKFRKDVRRPTPLLRSRPNSAPRQSARWRRERQRPGSKKCDVLRRNKKRPRRKKRKQIEKQQCE